MHRYPNDSMILQSPPLKVRWAGFESDTYTLQRAGWQFACEDYHYMGCDDHQIRFILRNDAYNLYGITKYFDYYQRFVHEEIARFGFEVAQFSNEMNYIVHGGLRPSFIQLNMEPLVSNINVYSLKELNIFRTAINEDCAIIVNQNDVQSLLQQIIKLQSPKQAELREESRKKGLRDMYNQKQTLHAQILTLAA